MICSNYNINYHWLKTGDGPEQLPSDSTEEMIDEIMSGESDFVRKMFRSFAKLSDDEWRIMKKVVEDLQREERKDIE